MGGGGEEREAVESGMTERGERGEVGNLRGEEAAAIPSIPQRPVASAAELPFEDVLSIIHDPAWTRPDDTTRQQR